jgi:CubicO group peptidase (beta-lactamase class C family)
MKPPLARWLGALLVSLPVALPASPPLHRGEVEAWADATFQQAFAEKRFSGLAITVVQDDAVIFSRGYGYADYQRMLPLDPERTRLRIGSITKTFTAIAISQLIERGAIGSIDDPANNYLKRDQLPKAAGKDITIRQLLTHTAGFDSRAFGLATEKEFALPLSAAEVRSHRPPIVRAPGERSVYSNYGTAMLAVIVEDVTGKSIRNYFDEHIFRPLQMHDSVLNVTPRPSANLAVPSRFFPDGSAQPQRFFGVHPFFAPVGAIEATPADMGRYMIANLQEGTGASSAVLGPEQFRELHRRIAGNNPATSGFGRVFITFDWNGVSFFGHGGDWPGFHSIMLMAPASRTGFFISCLCDYAQPGFLESLFGSQRMQSKPATPVREPMTNVGVAIAFLERFWGKRSWTPAPQPSDPEKFAGLYWHEFRNYRTAEKLFVLLGGPSATLDVRADGAGTLEINGRGGYGEIAPGVFWNAAGEAPISGNFWDSGLWAFTLDSKGEPQYASPTFAIDPYVRTSAVDNPQFALRVLLVSAVLMLTGVLAAFWPRSRGLERAGKWLPPAIAAGLLSLAPVLLAGYREGDGAGSALLLGQMPRFAALIAIANLIAAGGLVMLIVCALAWRRGFWGTGVRAALRRMHFTLLTAAAVALIWVFAFTNLLGLELP